MRGTRCIAALVLVAAAATMASAGVGELYRTEDWRTEKHVPVIECPVEFNAGEATTVTVTVGREIEHPNTALHHIRWIRLYFQPTDSTLPYEVASFDFSAHGESVQGSDTSSLYTVPKISVDFKTGVSGAFYATAYCNIHGLWESMKPVAVIEAEVEE
jgi:superoxide reductase